jgi:hypothetical protein
MINGAILLKDIINKMIVMINLILQNKLCHILIELPLIINIKSLYSFSMVYYQDGLIFKEVMINGKENILY